MPANEKLINTKTLHNTCIKQYFNFMILSAQQIGILKHEFQSKFQDIHTETTAK